MKDERRLRFAAYFAQRFKGDRARFMLATGLTKGRVTQLFDVDEPFGELAASRLAEKLKLPRDYFERDHAAVDVDVTEPPMTPKEHKWLQAFRDLPPQRADAKLKAVLEEAQEFRDYAEAVLSKKREPLHPSVNDESSPSEGLAGGRSNFGDLDETKPATSTPKRKTHR